MHSHQFIPDAAVKANEKVVEGFKDLTITADFAAMELRVMANMLADHHLLTLFTELHQACCQHLKTSGGGNAREHIRSFDRLAKATKAVNLRLENLQEETEPCPK